MGRSVNRGPRPNTRGRMKNMDEKEMQIRFTYHAPKDDQPIRYVNIREQGFAMASMINDSCPESREKSLAFTALEEAVMWANAAIARRE